MFHKEVLSQFQLALIKANVATVAPEQAIAPFTPDPEAEIITQDGTTGRRQNHERNRQAMGRPGIDGSYKQHSFAREGDACALDGYKDENGPITVRREKMRQVGHSKMEHRQCAFSMVCDFL